MVPLDILCGNCCPPSPQLEKKLWHFLRYFSKICPKKIKWANWAIFHNNASFEMSTIDSTAPSFQTCSILFVQKQQEAKSWFPNPRKVLLPRGWFTRTLLVLKKNLLSKGSHNVLPAEIRKWYNLIVCYLFSWFLQSTVNPSRSLTRVTHYPVKKSIRE